MGLLNPAQPGGAVKNSPFIYLQKHSALVITLSKENVSFSKKIIKMHSLQDFIISSKQPKCVSHRNVSKQLTQQSFPFPNI